MDAFKGGSRGAQLLLTLVIGGLVVLSAIAVVYAKYQSRTLFAELQKLKQQQEEMELEWGQLQLEQSTWATHGRMEHIASVRLGMRLPAPDQIVIIRP